MSHRRGGYWPRETDRDPKSRWVCKKYDRAREYQAAKADAAKRPTTTSSDEVQAASGFTGYNRVQKSKHLTSTSFVPHQPGGGDWQWHARACDRDSESVWDWKKPEWANKQLATQADSANEFQAASATSSEHLRPDKPRLPDASFAVTTAAGHENRKQNRKQKAEKRKQNTENRKQKTENRKQKTGNIQRTPDFDVFCAAAAWRR